MTLLPCGTLPAELVLWTVPAGLTPAGALAGLAALAVAVLAMAPAGPVYRLTLRPEPACPVPDGVRLKRLLKRLLRAYGLRCLAVEEVPPPTPGVPRDRPGQDQAARTSIRPEDAAGGAAGARPG